MNRPAMRFYNFGVFRVDTADRRLFRDGEEVPLSPKVFETLLLLLEKPGQLVGKDDLMERLWPGTFVGEDTLAQKISLLRKALNGANGSEGYISTVPRLGYRFTGEVNCSSPEAAVISGTTESGDEAAALPSINPVARNRNRRLIFIATLGILFCGAGIWWLTARYRSTTSPVTYQISSVDVSNLTVLATISPDGKYLAYVAADQGKQSIWARPVAAGGKGLQIVPPMDLHVGGISYSPNEEYLYYTVTGSRYGDSSLYRINSQGGTPQLLLGGVDPEGVEFEPGGQRMVFTRSADSYATGSNDSELVIARADGTEARTIARSSITLPFRGFHWSEDGKIVYAMGDRTKDGWIWYEAEVPANGGTESRVLDLQNRLSMVEVVQRLNRSEAVVLATDRMGPIRQVWAFDGTEKPKRVTNDTNDYTHLSIAPNAHRMLATRTDVGSSLWVADAAQTPRAGAKLSDTEKQILPESRNRDPVWTPDGNIVYTNLEGSGYCDLWLIGSDGTGQRRLTSGDAVNVNPHISPDGKYIVFRSSRNGVGNIWRVDIDGSSPRQLTWGRDDDNGVVSPDGKWLVYNSFTGGEWALWKMPISGGTATKFADSVNSRRGAWPLFSPDGKLITFEHFDPSNHQRRWGIFSFEDGTLRKELDLPQNGGGFSWSRDGKSLIYIQSDKNGQALWSQPITGETPRMIMSLGSDPVGFSDWSKDGKRILFTRIRVKRDLVLIDEVK